MRRRISQLLLASVLGVLPTASVALGQADARGAYDAGKAAWTAGEYEKARDEFARASQTDPKNAEVFLWLGKARYQLGEVDAAVEAWTTTLRLAPNEPYAAKMLAALKGELGKAANASALVDVLLKEQLYDAALASAEKLLADKAMGEAQRARALLQKAEALVGLGRDKDAPALVHEALVAYPKQTDAAQSALILGRAYLHMGGEKRADGLAYLKKVVAENANTPAAAVAQYELLAYDIDQGASVERVDALAKWLGANGQSIVAGTARAKLLDAYLTAAGATAAPGADAALGKEDQTALAAASELFKQTMSAGEADQLTRRIVGHLDAKYAKAGAFGAAGNAVDGLLKLNLPRSSRLIAMTAGARYRSEGALRDLASAMAAGGGAGMKGDALPAGLAEAVAALEAISAEFPAQGAWAQELGLADRVRGLAGQVQDEADFVAPRAPVAWATSIALKVAASGDEQAAGRAVELVSAIAGELAARPELAARRWAAGQHGKLLAAMDVKRTVWPAVALRQIDLLAAVAQGEFDDNVKQGKDAANEKLSDTQSQLLAVATQAALARPAMARDVTNRMVAHLQTWVNSAHYGPAEAAYEQLIKTLAGDAQRPARLARANLWVAQVTREHERLLSAKMTPPHALDAKLDTAMKEFYALESGLSEHDPLRNSVRASARAVVEHYKRLEYFDVAEKALLARPEGQAVAAADAARQLELGRLREFLARREVAEMTRERGAKVKLALTPAFKSAIETYQKILSDYPTSEEAEAAVAGVIGVARFFEQQQANDVAIEVYRGLATASAAAKGLPASTAMTAGVAERTAFAVATALDVRARAALGKMLADRKPDAPAPAKLSEESMAAISAYKDFIKARPTSGFVGAAVQNILGLALEYARADGWDVADGIYADLLQANLPLYAPERLEFARAMCQVGKAVPDHAKEVLGALTVGTAARGYGEPTSATAWAIPGTQPVVVMGGAMGPGGGRGGAGSGAGFEADDMRAGGKWDGSVDGKMRAGEDFPDAMPPAAIRPKAADLDMAAREADKVTLSAITQSEARRAQVVAQLRDRELRQSEVSKQPQEGQSQFANNMMVVAVLSDAELARQQTVIDVAYGLLKVVKDRYPTTLAAQQARAEMAVLIMHWREIGQWQRASALALQLVKDYPADPQVPSLRLQIGRDRLSYAALPVKDRESKQAMLAEVAQRFEKARAELAQVAKDYADERDIRQAAQWDYSTSFLTQARVINAFGPTLARAQYVRAAREMQKLASEAPEHPNLASVPQTLWQIASELSSRGYYDEAITVWNDLINFDPTNGLAWQSATLVASTYQNNLDRPLRAVESYLEINFARGGADAASQNAILAIGSNLKDQKRWVEALGVLETFVDSFPRHAQAGQALAMIGQIHQANEAWADAIAAYKRVVDEFPGGQWVQEARWSIAECTINLSQWRQAVASYEEFVKTYPGDGRVAEANRRVGVLKDLARYQTLVDEPGQRKAFDAQFQIAQIVQAQLANPQKAIIEYRKVVDNFAKSHLADDSLYYIGQLYLQMGEVQKGRASLRDVFVRYPDSNIADDALFQLGRSFEEEAQRLAGMTRGATEQQAKEIAQRDAYRSVQMSRADNRNLRSEKIQDLKKSGKNEEAELQEAGQAAQNFAWNAANFELAAQKANQDVEALTAVQLADKKDKIDTALRKAVEAYASTAKVPGADRAGDALLRMAVIQDEQLKDPQAALATWEEIVRQFSGSAVAEEASWRIAQYYDRAGEFGKSVEAYKQFLRNYRSSGRAGEAQFAIAEGYEHLNKWVEAMDAYTNYQTNFAGGPLAQKAKDQISWIKQYRL